MEELGGGAAVVGAVALALAWIGWRWVRRLRRLLVLGLLAAGAVWGLGGGEAAWAALRGALGIGGT